MYRWRIDIILKSGKEMAVIYEGEESNSMEVASNQFFSKRPSAIADFKGTKECSQHVFVTVGEIAAFGISVA